MGDIRTSGTVQHITSCTVYVADALALRVRTYSYVATSSFHHVHVLAQRSRSGPARIQVT